MWEWYRIGVAAGIGVGIALVAAGWLAKSRAGALLSILIGAAAGVAVGLALGDWPEAVGGAIGGVLGGLGAAPLAAGTWRRGGTVVGTGILIGLAGLGIAALALVPFLGYLEAAALPALAARAHRREPERYAGLRTLARD
jgi:MFS family permease